MPLAHDAVAGLINLRGQIVPELDVRRLFQMPPREPNEPTFSVVVRTEHGAVSLRVDQIDDVLDLDDSSLEAAPQNAEPHLRALMLGVHKLTNRLLIVLNTRQTVNVGAE